MEILKKDLNISSKTATSLAIAFVFFLFLSVAAAHHEPFCDELNVYMAIRHFDFIGLARYIFNDGNLPGFYILSYLPVKMGLPFASMQLMCAFFSAAAVFLLFNFSPFPLWLNTAIALSAPMLYFFPIITRPYSLLPFIVVGAAASWPYNGVKDGQSEKISCILFSLFVVCIALNHVISFMFAFCLLLMFIHARIAKEGRLSRMTIILSAFISMSLLFVIAESLNAVGKNAMYSVDFSLADKFHNVIRPFFATFFDATNSSIFYHSHFPHSGALFASLTAFSILLFIAAIVYFFSINLVIGLAAAASVGFPLYITLAHYSVIMPNRVYITHLVFMFFLWISLKDKNLSDIKRKIGIVIVGMLFSLSVPTGIYFHAMDWKGYFSSAEKAAAYLNDNVSDDGKNAVLATVHWQGLSVAHYAEMPIYQLDGSRIEFYGSGIAENRLAESGLLNDRELVYVVASKYQTESLAALGYELLYSAPESMLPEEDYAVFRKRIK